MTIPPKNWTRARASNSTGNCIEMKADEYGPFVCIRESEAGERYQNIRVTEFEAWKSEIDLGLYSPTVLSDGRVQVSIPRGPRSSYFDSPPLQFMTTLDNWRVFVAGLRAGDFNRVLQEVWSMAK